jgi:predicted phosphodiesterase
MIASSRPMTRRAFVHNSVLVMTSAAIGSQLALAAEQPRRVRIGLVTDLHYANKPPLGSRHYRDTLGKLTEAIKQFDTDKTDFAVELGDLIDAADTPEVELGYLAEINKVWQTLKVPRYSVLGNHCVDMLTKEEFLGGIGQKESRYSFDAGGVHFVVLDACFRADGKPYGRKSAHWQDANLPDDQLEWLAADLKATDKPVVVFAHQRLDETKHHSVKNAAAARKIFEASGKVLAVLQGHSHANDYQAINGIHYATLVAMVEGTAPENNGYSLLDIMQDGSLILTGFRKQAKYEWTKVSSK